MARSSFVMRMDIDRLRLRRIQRFLNNAAGFGDELRAILDETSAEIEVKAHARAPIGETLQLSQSITRTIDPRPVPLWAKVTANATNGTFRYGWALEGSKAVIYRYRHGPRTLRTTRKWFTGALGGARKRLEQRLDRLARRTERRWRAAA